MTNWINANAAIQSGHRASAQTLAESLWKNGERYHAGAIGHDEFAKRNIEIWKSAEREGLADAVNAILRRAR